MEEKLEYYNDRDVVYTNHLENLRGRNTKKRYLVPISSNTLASLSMEAAMPALSSLVAGNGEHTGTEGSWRCPAVVFTIAGSGSLQTGTAAAASQVSCGHRRLWPSARRRRGLGAGRVGFPTRVAAGSTTRVRSATRHALLWRRKLRGPSAHSGSTGASGCSLGAATIRHQLVRAAQLRRGGVTEEGVARAEKHEVQLSSPTTPARAGCRSGGLGDPVASGGVGVGAPAQWLRPCRRGRGARRGRLVSKGQREAVSRRPATAARSRKRIMSSRRRLWRRQLLWPFLHARSKSNG